MPNTQSAKKALRSSSKKRSFNLEKKFKIKNSVKELRRAITMGNKDLTSLVSKAFSTLDKAAKTKFIHKNKASRRKSRISKMVKKALET